MQILVPNGVFQGRVQLPPSKSLANRAAILLSLAGVEAEQGLQSQGVRSKDTDIIVANLKNARGKSHFDAGDAGTAYRFLTARLALFSGKKTLTGSERMLERPIGPLVDALRNLGVAVNYLGKEGYPPLEIGDCGALQTTSRVDLQANLSSQYASALLMIGPYLPQGLNLRLVGAAVSLSYLRMTVRLMRLFGAIVTWRGRDIRVQQGLYSVQTYNVEADWSAASYFYALAALRPGSILFLPGLHKNSAQGDVILVKWMRHFGVQSRFEDGGLTIKSKKIDLPKQLRLDFLESPDLAQTFFVLCAALGVELYADNVQTLRIKETDRIAAMQTELGKLGVRIIENKLSEGDKSTENVSIILKGKAKWSKCLTFATYKDHRMAMALAPLATLGSISFDEPLVVEKSFPAFWTEMAAIYPKNDQ